MDLKEFVLERLAWTSKFSSNATETRTDSAPVLGGGEVPIEMIYREKRRSNASYARSAIPHATAKPMSSQKGGWGRGDRNS